MKDYLMSQKEANRAGILQKVKENETSLKKAAELLSLSYPQIKRVYSLFKRQGTKGLISKKRGKKSNRAVSEVKQKEIVKIIIEQYRGCKPLFVSEKLNEHHGIKYSSEFIRKLMIAHHLWVPKEKKRKIHQRRARRESEGELEQADASNHAWFEERGPKCHLHIIIDDATSKIPVGHFAFEETTEAYFRLMKSYLEKQGRPISLYTDKRGTFKVNQGNIEKDTQFKRALKELDIKIIYANSPEAKGRVERAFGTLQERLVWEMRIREISTIEEANAYLPEFLEQHNKRYAVPAKSMFDAHRALDPKKPLKYILCEKETRTISKNLEVQYNNQIYQLRATPEIELKLKKSKITVITTLEGELVFDYKGSHIEYRSYAEMKYEKPKIALEELLGNWSDKRRNKKKPSKYHPWNQSPKKEACY